MSIKNIESADLRAEAARHRVTRGEIAKALGVSYEYVQMIFADKRKAPERRAQIQEYIKTKIKNNEMRGIS